MTDVMTSCSVKLQLICLRIWYHSFRHASWPIETQREKLLNAPPPDMPTNSVKPYQACLCYVANVTFKFAEPVPLCVESCNCNKYACWASAVECRCEMNAYSISMPVNHLPLNPACMIKWGFSICHTCMCGVSLSAMSAVVVPHYRSCLLACSLIIGHIFWCGTLL